MILVEILTLNNCATAKTLGRVSLVNMLVVSLSFVIATKMYIVDILQ